MTDANQGPIDLDTLTDDEVKNLGPDQVQALMDQEGQENVEQDPPVQETPSEDVDADQPDADDGDNDEPVSNGEQPETPVEDSSQADPDGSEDGQDPIEPEPQGKDPENDPDQSQKTEAKEEDPAQKAEKPAEKTEKTDKDADPDKAGNKPEAVDNTAAIDFFKKVSAPFKADGKDIQVRTPEDAIRLMQMGVNYSRRMQEMKPMKALQQMLSQNGLDDAEKLNELIDISKGNPAAIQKLLKDKGIDPLDIDTSSETPYKATNYQSDPKDIAFQEAIDNTMAAEGGRDIIVDINKTWDDTSKEALRDQPVIFQNLLAQKHSGVYEKIKSELEYQRTMGFLTDVPFLQAYHQVGDAMQKAGVFGPQPQVQSEEPAPQQVVPIDTGIRKAAPKPKTEQPNPNLSSTTQPRIVPSNDGGQQDEPDYSSMSDDAFLKLGIPS